MAEQQTIKYAPQWNNMTVDNVTFQTNNVVGNFNYPPNVPAYKPIINFLLNCPLKKAFTNCPSAVYQNFLREFWSTAVAYDPFPSTDETEQRPLREFLIKFLKDSVSPLPLAAKPKKGKSQTVTLTLPKSQGPEVLGALSMKCKRPKSKKPPTETKVTPPKPMEGFEQSHSVSLGTVPDPQDLERDIQLASMGLPSTLNEGTRTSKPFLEGTVTHPKDLGRNIQTLDRDLTSMTSDEGTAKTMPRLEGSLGDKDSGGNIPPVDIKPIHTTIADPSG
ncbi:hypothetical protein Tco_1552863, partial [Tanacetum coccineum]